MMKHSQGTGPLTFSILSLRRACASQGWTLGWCPSRDYIRGFREVCTGQEWINGVSPSSGSRFSIWAGSCLQLRNSKSVWQPCDSELTAYRPDLTLNIHIGVGQQVDKMESPLPPPEHLMLQQSNCCLAWEGKAGGRKEWVKNEKRVIVTLLVSKDWDSSSVHPHIGLWKLSIHSGLHYVPLVWDCQLEAMHFSSYHLTVYSWIIQGNFSSVWNKCHLQIFFFFLRWSFTVEFRLVLNS